ncbi:glycerate kinase [Sulfoacidibacillus thermotolerans]|uniref:Glycerate kinase n=1 Tax=Sulfoacidibacillus thermotolerans TaxID=1765684 RepID=A0A2U3D705_SULT2|nr:glycerate kinase [Sulfoacidibacillus thermotolerans]PWI57033.1 hypothetical protein BM613_10755 [Sulfoacidibacillus thermotolerans]
MRILIAPDSFKGSLPARAVAQHMENGIKKVAPHSTIKLLPLADGGEGTLDCLLQAKGGYKVSVPVHDPLGRNILAQYGVLPDGTAVIEAAAAIGYHLMVNTQQDVRKANSVGVGELIKHALEAGHTSLMIGLGGSGTNDGGVGMLHALGIRLLNAAGEELPLVPLACQQLERIDDTELHPQIRLANIRVVADVTNPLCGPSGATAIYGPQKGIAHQWINLFDQALAKFAEVVEKQFGVHVASLPGAGAAGGLGAALVGVLGAKIYRGIEQMLDWLDFDMHATRADLIFTGEGKTDSQTLHGKAVFGVAQRARRVDTPVICISGSIDMTASQIDQLGVTGLLSIVPGPMSLEQAFHDAAFHVERTSQTAMQIFLANSLSKGEKD